MDEQSIFLEALEKASPKAQAAWLDEACGEDEALKQRLAKMLRKHEHAKSFLEQAAPGLEATIASERENISASLDAGLTPAFGDDAAVVIGDANHSVLRALDITLDEIPAVSLREPEVEDSDPITRSNSPEVPKQDPGSRYRLDGEIARGGMGAIIKGRDTDLGRDLAIKVLLDSHKDKPDVIQRFVEEAQIGGQLQHPGIAPVYELGQFADKRPFFSMKLVKGRTLARLLADREDAGDDRARFLGIFEQVCRTMAYAHSRGVIHRDLKPANIMVGAFGEVQVMDWGLAKVLSDGGVADEKKSLNQQQDQSIIQTLRSGVGSDAPAAFGSAGSETQMGSVMGTPAYMPPEQALGEIDNLDERADVFSLGAILCEILTGKPPYVADDGTRVFRLASRGKLDDCFERLDTCGASADLILIAKYCFELEPVDRPRDAGVLSDRITQYLESVESKLRETEKRRAAEAARAIEERKRRRVIVASFCAVAALLVVIAAGSILAANHFRKMADLNHSLAQDNQKLANDKQGLAEEAEYRLIRSYVAAGSKALERDEPFDALFWSGRALQADKARESNEEYHRMRIAGTLAEVPRLAGVCFHVAPVLDVDINRDGTRLVTRTKEQRAFVWDFVAGKLAAPPLQHAGAVRHVEFSPDGALILTASEDKTAALWNAGTGSRVLVLQHNASVCAASFSKDGRTVVSVAGNQVWRWDALTGQSLGDPSECQDVIWHLSVNRERNLAVTADNSGHARVWDISTGEKVCELVKQRVPSGEDLDFYCLGPTLSPNGKILVAFDPTRGKWKAYNVSNDQEIWSVPAQYVSTPSWSHDSRHAVVETLRDGRIRLREIVDANSGEKLAEFPHRRQSALAALSHDGRLFAGESGGGICIWNTATGKKRGQRLQFADFLKQLRVSSDGKWLVACALDGTARVWDLSPRNLTKPYSQDCGRAHFAMYDDGSSFSPDGRYRFKSDQTGGVLESSVEEALRLPHSSRVDASCFSEDGKRLATLAGNEVRVWDVPSGKGVGPAKIIKGEFSAPPRLELTSDGDIVAAVFARRRPASFLAWHTTDQLLLKIPTKISNGPRIHGPIVLTGQVTDVRLSSDGRLAAAAVESTGELFVYSVESSKLRYRRRAFRGWLGGLSFSDDGKVLFVGSGDQQVRQFFSETGKPAGPALRHPSLPILIGVEPKGNRVATLSEDRRLRLWDRLTGDLLASIPAGQFGWLRNRRFSNCWFSSDGATVQYGSSQQIHSLRVPKYEGRLDAVPLAIQLITGKQWDDRGGVLDLWADEFIEKRDSYRKAWLAWQQLSDARDTQP